jgi:hypothetical protein
MDGAVCSLCFLLPVPLLMTTRPPSTRLTRFTVKKKEPLVFPDTCVVTGEQSVEKHVIDGFSYFGNMVVKHEVALPFSADGWAQYNKRYPISSKIMKGGFRVFWPIPLFNMPFLFLWGLFGGMACSIIAVYDLLMGRKQLVILYETHITKGELCGIEIAVASKAFAEEFVRLNLNTTLERHQEKRKKKQQQRILLLLLAIIGMLIMGCALLLWAPS